jgi:pilus assembly protein TadC
MNSLKAYISTLFSGAMIGFVGIHTLEDIILLSIGRFAPLPLIAMYALGLAMSWLVMGALLHKVLGRKPHEHH